MLRNYFKIALRTLRKDKIHTLINVFGLALGLACCLLIGLYVQDELSYDRFHADADRIYRLVQQTDEGGTAYTGPGFRLYMEDDFPEVEAYTRITREGAHVKYTEATPGAEQHFQETVYYADSNFFDVFSFKLKQGNPATVLGGRNTVVLSERAAEKYFSDDDPIGKTLVLDNSPSNKTLTVTGIVETVPENSHLQFDLLSSYATYLSHYNAPTTINSFYWPFGWTYVRVPNEATAERIDKALPDFAIRRRGAELGTQFVPQLEPLTDIHLHSAYSGNPTPSGHAATIYLFGSIALFVLLIACINFINLATARGLKRAKEVGVRKSVGANRSQLISQFLSESVLLSMMALGVAFVIVQVLLPFFNDLSDKSLSILAPGKATIWIGLLVLVVVTGLASGSYPALFLSAFQPTAVLKGRLNVALRGSFLQKGLVVFQFTVSIVLIVATLFAHRQLSFMQNARLGFDESHVVSMPFYGIGATEDSETRYETLKAELLRQPQIQSVTSATSRPGLGVVGSFVFEAEGMPEIILGDEGERQINLQMVNDDFFDLFEMPLVAGRAPSTARASDLGTSRDIPLGDGASITRKYENRAFVINETMARESGWTPEEALGKNVRFYITENGIIYQDYAGEVVGVVQDYHQGALRETIAPLAYTPALLPDGNYARQSHLLVKTAPGNAAATIATLREVWERAGPARPFDATFLDTALNEQYRSERTLSKIFAAFAILAMLIACLGLFGLATYTAERRIKEIGVRKVLGASVPDIVSLLSRDFLLLVLGACLVAAPIAYVATERWLSAFAYRIETGLWTFLIAALIALFIAFATVSYQAIRAALTDPVKSLRYE